jgi:hypothetical protein
LVKGSRENLTAIIVLEYSILIKIFCKTTFPNVGVSNAPSAVTNSIIGVGKTVSEAPKRFRDVPSILINKEFRGDKPRKPRIAVPYGTPQVPRANIPSVATNRHF